MEYKYLKPNLVIEPLIERWYAWPHLVSPATCAMNIVGRHIKIMDSYIQSPQIHIAAVKNPKLLGGPFMDYKESRVNAVRALKETTLSSQGDQVAFALAVVELDSLLRKNADGSSLEKLYAMVPDLLKGYVELVYDLNNNVSFRLFEPLLYKSKYYNQNSQSIALWTTDNDERPFCLSTPRLNEPDVIHLQIPFNSDALDILSQMKRNPGNVEEIAELLKISSEQRMLFESFFTSDVPPGYEKYLGESVRMRYFGHACILLETKEFSILVDPLISYYGYPSEVSHYSDMDLPEVIDYVLITHNHQDHILFETLLPLRHKIKNIIVPRTTNGSLQDPNLKLMFNSIGFKNVLEIDDLEEIQFNNCVITGIPFTGEHSDLNIKAKTCYHISVGENSFLFVADSRVLESRIYQQVQSIIGDVDVIFLGMECDGAPLTWLYGPLLTQDIPRDKDQSRRLSGSDFQRGMHLVDTFHPKEVYVYAMGQEPWLEFISTIKYSEESNPIIQSNKLVDECSSRNIIAERLFGEKELLYKTI